MGLGIRVQDVPEAGIMVSRLAVSERLPLPSSLYKDTCPMIEDIEHYLTRLIETDCFSFLQKYGLKLTEKELQIFSGLRGDFEINYLLTQYTQVKSAHADAQHLPALVKNRRLAFMERLESGGEYFRDENMRDRAPLLYEEYIGRYIAPVPPTGKEMLSESIVRQHHELEHTARLNREIKEEDMQYEEEEEESDDDDDDVTKTGVTHSGFRSIPHTDGLKQQHASMVPEAANTRPTQSVQGQDACQQPSTAQHKHEVHDGDSSGPASPAQDAGTEHGIPGCSRLPHEAPKPEDLALLREYFMQEMRSRFLLGQDGAYVDYAQIDADCELDDVWLENVRQDAEDRYFEGDDESDDALQEGSGRGACRAACLIPRVGREMTEEECMDVDEYDY